MKQDYPKDKLEVIVVDDGSTDGTARIVQKYNTRYIHQENAGPAAARNTGWKAAKGEIVCFTDSDCIPHRNWIRELVMCYVSRVKGSNYTKISDFDLQTESDIGAVGGSYDIANTGNLLAECIHEEILWRHSRMPKIIMALGSYNLSVRRDVLEMIDGFSEEYRCASGEDNDLSYRILKAGYKLCFQRDALVAHYHPENLRRYLKEQYNHGYWRMKLYRDHPDRIRGDDYTTWKDVVEPPLSIAIIGLLIFWLSGYLVSYLFDLSMEWLRHLIMASFILLLVDLFLQFILPMRIYIERKRLRSFVLIPVTFLRGFARGWGMARGIWRFYLRG